MSSDKVKTTGTSEEVLQYYSRNWEKIANCYSLDEEGLPVDPAWYRRRLYQDFLRRHRPTSLLDIGCGGGWTVLDALQLGIDAKGIEPVLELKNFGSNLIKQNGFDPKKISQDDLNSCMTLPSDSLDCIALLSVLAHVPFKRWDEIHQNISRILRPGGKFFAAYRNELFDLYTFNSFTVEFYDKSLWNCQPCTQLHTNQYVNKLKELIKNPDVPGEYFTDAQDKSFGRLERIKMNPLSLPLYLAQFNLQVKLTKYYHFHCAPPLMLKEIENYRHINHQLELSMSDDWRGNFMAAVFVIEAVRV
jgi:SAM-dependent methyltransferase